MTHLMPSLLLIAIIFQHLKSSCARSDAICGHRPMVDRLAGRVVGGKDSFYGQVPWQGLVKESRLFGLIEFRKCGAVLISDRWALTAAHCSAGWLGELVIILGEHDIGLTFTKGPAGGVIERKVKQIFIHPLFDRLHLENDIAIVELETPVAFDKNIQAVCLPRKREDFSNQEGYVSGWGYTAYRAGRLPNVLQVVKLPILSNARCEQMYKKAGYGKSIKSSVLCAGLAEGGKDSCEGDSGGPLMVYSKARQAWILAGIVSNGIRCAEPNLPGVYTRTSEFLDWIASVTQANN